MQRDRHRWVGLERDAGGRVGVEREVQVGGWGWGWRENGRVEMQVGGEAGERDVGWR